MTIIDGSGIVPLLGDFISVTVVDPDLQIRGGGFFE